MIVAVSHLVFDAASTGSDPNQNPLCGLKLRAERYDEQVGGRRSVDLKVVDRCKFFLFSDFLLDVFFVLCGRKRVKGSD